jgi:hypothetical protein
VNSRNRRIAIVGAIMLLLATVALRDMNRLGALTPWHNMLDFPDFYCAGFAIDDRASPYTYEPIHRCEHDVNIAGAFRSSIFQRNPAVAFPAPQPPYDFVPFMALARLPVALADRVDAVAILTAVALCVAALGALGIPLELAAATLLLSVAYADLNSGQIVPFALLALVLCGLALARRRDALAGVFAVLTAIEPIAGVAVTLALFAFVPRSRVAIAVSALVLAALSIALVGPRVLFDYVIAVLPAHAASEVHFPFQYSLTYALGYFGFAPSAARLAGELSYILLLAVGLTIAPRLSASLRRRELLAFVPALSVTIAAPFLHQEELCFAIPSLLVLAVATHGRSRTVAACALGVLAVPWILVWGAKQLFLASIFVCAAILLRLRIDPRAGLGFLFGVAALLYLFELHPPHLPVPSALRGYAPSELVQNEWRDYAEGRSSGDALWLAIKLPTWGALLAALAIAVCCSPRPPLSSESNRENSHETPGRPPASQRARTD